MQKSRDFVDEARVQVRGGDGGNGAASFRREKYRPKGGPDGGNGGDGGSVVLRVTPGVATLSELARSPHVRAERGRHGQGSDKHAPAAADQVVPVPAGTIVRDASGAVLADLVDEGRTFIAARGGKGGRGNAALTTARRKAPGFAERGEAGEERWLDLELRVLADVGLVGLPNAGKSSLVAQLSAVADVPGLIEGSAGGKGLGLAFLRHLERCRVLCFVVDLAAGDPADAIDVLGRELRAYDQALLDRTAFVAANKIDLPEAKAHRDEVRAAWGRDGFYPVSALTGEGVEDLAAAIGEEIARQRADVDNAPPLPAVLRIRPESDSVDVLRENEAYRVRSARAERLVSRFDLTNPDAVRYVQERLVGLGVEEALEKAGAKAGDEVRIGDEAFEFIPERSA
jgi:GTPase